MPRIQDRGFGGMDRSPLSVALAFSPPLLNSFSVFYLFLTIMVDFFHFSFFGMFKDRAVNIYSGAKYPCYFILPFDPKVPSFKPICLFCVFLLFFNEAKPRWSLSVACLFPCYFFMYILVFGRYVFSSKP